MMEAKTDLREALLASLFYRRKSADKRISITHRLTYKRLATQHYENYRRLRDERYGQTE